MSLLLAPYQSSMKLGSGFNSYTQQLCVDDAVLSEGPEEGGRTGEISHLSSSGEVAQSVIFKTEMIQKMSDLTDALDINGALNIKASNIANARGNGTFVNSDVIKESNINFLLTCKVVNQTTHDHSLTKFSHLTNTDQSNFTDIFGDCFISGFQWGGEFAALISIKVHDKEQLASIAAQAQLAFTTPSFGVTEEAKPSDNSAEAGKPVAKEASKPAEGKPAEGTPATDKAVTKPDQKAKAAGQAGKGVSIEADAKFKKTRLDIMSQNTVTISVSWTGGGQSLKGSKDDWNFETLRAAAIKFPELVAQTPVRTHAVLKKYNTLRSYHASFNKASSAAPASYENAGVFTNMLQDAYLDYKNLYKDLQLLGMDVDAGRKCLRRGDEKLLVDAPSTDKGDEQDKLKVPSPKSDPLQADQSSTISVTPASTPATEDPKSQPPDETKPSPDKGLPQGPLKPPVKPFMLDKFYSASLVGLELAKRDIRINMSRILLEVDTIAKDPSLAMDENRVVTFLSPLLFKQFVPKGEVISESAPATQ